MRVCVCVYFYVFVHVCVENGSSMEGAATEHKVPLRIHKWGADIWMTLFASVFLPLFTWHTGNRPPHCHAHRQRPGLLTNMHLCVRDLLLKCQRQAKAAYLNTVQDGWIPKHTETKGSYYSHVDRPEAGIASRRTLSLVSIFASNVCVSETIFSIHMSAYPLHFYFPHIYNLS